MQTPEELLSNIVTTAAIPGDKRRTEVLRELAAHVEDFRIEARTAGHVEDDIDRMIAERFGDPREIAAQFGWVYRRERSLHRIATFLVTTVAVAIAMSVTVVVMHAGVGAGFGIPIARPGELRHAFYITLNIASTVAAFVGLISLERLFGTAHSVKAILRLAIGFGAAFGLLSLAGLRPQFLVFGFVIGLILRGLLFLLTERAAQFAAVVLLFAGIGFVSSLTRPWHDGLLHDVASWMVNGTGYFVLTRVAIQVERAVSKGLEQI